MYNICNSTIQPYSYNIFTSLDVVIINYSYNSCGVYEQDCTRSNIQPITAYNYYYLYSLMEKSMCSWEIYLPDGKSIIEEANFFVGKFFHDSAPTPCARAPASNSSFWWRSLRIYSRVQQRNPDGSVEYGTPAMVFCILAAAVSFFGCCATVADFFFSLRNVYKPITMM